MENYFFERHFESKLTNNLYDLISDVEYIYDEYYIKDILYKKSIRKLISNYDYLQINRLSKWLLELKEIIPYNSNLFNKIATAVAKAFVKNEIIRTQTVYEFEISISLIKEIQPILINRFEYAHIDDLTFVINTSLFYGKYPGYLQAPIKTAFSYFKNGIDDETKVKCIDKLFVKYEPIHSFLIVFKICHKVDQFELFRYLFQGKNIRKYNSLFSNLTQNEVNTFKKIEDLTNLHLIDSFEKLIIFIKLYVINQNEKDSLITFLNCSMEFINNDELFLKKISFWKDAYCLYLKHSIEEREYLFLDEYFEFLDEKHYLNEKFSLKKSTPKSLEIAMNKMHLEIFEKDKPRKLKLEWTSSEIDDVYIQFEDNLYLFKELINGTDLFEESKKMNHCVFSYADNCSNGRSKIWSIQHETKKGLTNYITIEVKSGVLVQAYKFDNKKINQYDLQLIRFWAKEHTIEFDENIPVFTLPEIVKFDTSEFDFENDGIEIEF